MRQSPKKTVNNGSIPFQLLTHHGFQTLKKTLNSTSCFRGMFKSWCTEFLAVGFFEYDFAFAVHSEIVSISQ